MQPARVVTGADSAAVRAPILSRSLLYIQLQHPSSLFNSHSAGPLAEFRLSSHELSPPGTQPHIGGPDRTTGRPASRRVTLALEASPWPGTGGCFRIILHGPLLRTIVWPIGFGLGDETAKSFVASSHRPAHRCRRSCGKGSASVETVGGSDTLAIVTFAVLQALLGSTDAQVVGFDVRV